MRHGANVEQIRRFITGFGAVALTLAAAADWPQFQGPDRDGTSPAAGLARTWPAEGPPVLWDFALGEGFAGPAIRDGAVYILDRVNDSHDILRCIDLKTGEERWRYGYAAPGSVSHDGSRTTPTVTETHVYTVGLMGHFYCFERATGLPVWSIELAKDFPPVSELNWGYAQAPTIYNDLVIVAPQSKRAFVVAFNKLTGDLVWKSKRLGDPSYVSPLVTRLSGVDQVVMIAAGKDGVHGLSLEDGSILWTYGGWNCRIPIPHPTPLPGDRLFITGEYGAGSAMIQVNRSNGKFQVKEFFTTKDCESQIHQPLLFDGYLYMNSNGNSRNDGMACLSLDGKLQWKTRGERDLPRFERGGLLLADGMIVNFDGAKGTLHLIQPSPSGYVELARAKMFDGQKMWAPMALSDGRLVLRSQEQMKCLDLRAQEAPRHEFLLP